METNQAALNTETGAVQYGTRTSLDNEYDGDIKVRKSYDPIRCGGTWTKKKKLTVGFFVLLIFVIVLVVIIAVLSIQKGNKQPISSRNGKSSNNDCDAGLLCKSGVRFSNPPCIKPEFLCDGFEDCIDGDDESEDACKKKLGDIWRECADDEWRCMVSSECIPIKQRCDSESQCKDGSDEMKCVEVDDEARVVIKKEGNDEHFLSSHGLPGDVRKKLCSLVGFSEDGARFNPRVDEREEANAQQMPCAKLNSTVRFTPEKILRNIDIGKSCEDGQVLGITCQPDMCGQFRDFDGPYVPKPWRRKIGDFSSSPPEDFPWIVYIIMDNEIRCLGTIISHNYILTTETCVGVEDLGNYRVEVQAGHWKEEQRRSVYKRIVHHGVESGSRNNEDELIVLLELVTPFVTGKAVTPICVREPKYKDKHNACFASGILTQDGNVMEHVRLTNIDCKEDKEGYCYYTNSSVPCLDQARGGPVSCYDFEYNRFVLRGLVEPDKVGCSGVVGERKSLRINKNLASWVQQLTAPLEDTAKLCGGFHPELARLRFPKGNREKEFYIEGSGQDVSGWHALASNETDRRTLENLLLGYFGDKKSLLIKKTSSSDITVKRVFRINCPDFAETICDCSFSFENTTSEAVSYIIYQGQDDEGGDGGDVYDYVGDDDEDLDDSDYDMYDEIVDEGDTLVQCDNGENISELYFCDDDDDCLDGSDEQLELCLMYQNEDRTACEDAYICEHDYKCIKREMQCDGFFDCEDRSDELRCVNVVDDNKMVVINDRGLWYLLLAEGLFDDETNKPNANAQVVADSLCKQAGFMSYNNSMTASDLGDLKPVGARCKKVDFRPDSDQSAFKLRPVDDGDCTGKMIKLACHERECGNPIADPLREGDTFDMPWLAEIVRESGSVRKCYATFISDEWIATPLSCIDELSSTRVKLPGRNPLVVQPIIQKKFHIARGKLSDTNSTDNYATNDITLLNVKTNGSFDLVQPICIGHPMMSKCVIHAYKNATTLETFKVLLMDQEECSRELRERLQWNIMESIRCFIYPNTTAQDLLHMKGSPVACYDKVTERWSLAGIALGNAYSRPKFHDNVGIAVNIRDEDMERWIETPLIAMDPDEKFEIKNGSCTLRFYRGSVFNSYYAMFNKDNKDKEWYNLDPTETEGSENRTASLFNLLGKKLDITLEDGVEPVETEGRTFAKNIATWICIDFTTELNCECVANFKPAVPNQSVKLYIYEDEDFDWIEDNLPEEDISGN